MKVLIATMPIIGHVGPVRPIARELVERGHRVRWWTGPAMQSAVLDTGAEFVEMKDVPLAATVDALDEVFPERAALKGMDKLRWDITHVFLEPIPTQVAELCAELAATRADVVISDVTVVGAGALHELEGIPWASVGVMPFALPSRDTAPFGTARPPARSRRDRLLNRALYLFQDRVVLREPAAYHNRIRADLGLPHTRNPVMVDGFSPMLHLQSGVAELEYPRSDLPPQVHFVGGLAEPTPDLPVPDWWPEVAGSERPIVHVSQGTVADATPEDLVLPTIRALADLEVLVVATTGRHDPAALGPLPGNAYAARMLPYQLLLPRCAAMVTNGGYGGVQQALAHGVPLVVAGASEDKPEVAARVGWSGAGIDLRTARPTEAEVGAAVRSVLGKETYRRHARRLRAAYLRTDAGPRSAELVEQLVAGGAPVGRVAGAPPNPGR